MSRHFCGETTGCFVPVENKYLLTVEEAAEYTNIGTKKIREMMRDPRCDFMIRVGSKHLIRRMGFEDFLDKRSFL